MIKPINGPIEKAVKEDRVQTKYNKMVEKGIYFTSQEIANNQNEKEYFFENVLCLAAI